MTRLKNNLFAAIGPAILVGLLVVPSPLATYAQSQTQSKPSKPARSATGISTQVTPQSGGPAVHGIGTAGMIPIWLDANSIGDSTIVESGGNIGIGTAGPGSKLSVAGMIEAALGGYKFPDGTIQTTAAVSGLGSVVHNPTLTGNGTSASPLGVAVPLTLDGSTATPIIQATQNGSSFAVEGINNSGVAVVGSSISSIGVRGVTQTGAGVSGASVSSRGVEGTSQTGVGVFGSSVGSLGVEGSSQNGFGVHGISTNNTGVVGESDSQPGVEGDSNTNAGVVGTSNSSAGVSGFSTNAFAVQGESPAGGGVLGISKTNAGVQGNSTSSIGVVGSSLNDTAFFGNATAGHLAGLFNGDVQVTGNLSKAGGSFKIDHPLDPENKYLYHSFVESPDMMNIYNGNVTTDPDGNATIMLPDWFESLNRDFRYQLTVIGTFAQAIVAEKIKGNRFQIKTNAPNVEVSWQVTGIRQDPWANKHRIPVEEEKTDQERAHFLHPELYDQPEEKSVDFARHPELMRSLKDMREQANKKD